jgi:hypothetical protein
MEVLFVTHTFRLASALWLERRRNAAFLRAERLADGTRTFRLIEGQPLETSFGKDLYDEVFGAAARSAFREDGEGPGDQLPETTFRDPSPASTST